MVVRDEVAREGESIFVLNMQGEFTAGQDRTRQDRTGQDKTRQDKTG